jgi:antitoxin component of MazEF toxin-antitoxin module
MKAKVQRRDGELVVVLPEEVAKTELIDENIEVEVRNPGLHPVFYMTLDEICDRITPETLHGETDWGPDVGKEIVEW